MIFLGPVQECWSNGAQRKAGPSKKVGYRGARIFCPLCSPLLLLFLSTGLALLVWQCCAVCSLWAGKGLAGRLGQSAPDWRVGGGLSRHRAPLFASPARQLVWDFWEGSPPLSFFYLRRIIALSRGSQDSKSLCRTAGHPRDVPLDQPQLPSPFPPTRSLERVSL